MHIEYKTASACPIYVAYRRPVAKPGAVEGCSQRLCCRTSVAWGHTWNPHLLGGSNNIGMYDELRHEFNVIALYIHLILDKDVGLPYPWWHFRA